MLRNVIALGCLVGTVLFAASCTDSQDKIANGDDPLASLSSTMKSSRYGRKFWRVEINGSTTLWLSAVSFCSDAQRADYPNCQVVNDIKWIGPIGEVPKYDHSDGFADMPKINPVKTPRVSAGGEQ